MSLLLGLLLSQGAEPRLDYVSKAVPLKVALEQISKLAGTRLFVDQELELEPLVFRLKSVPLGEFKAKLADCLDAEWKPVSNGERLQRSEAIRKRLWEEQVEIDAVALRAALDRAIKNERLEPFTDEEAQAVASMLMNTEQKLKEDPAGNNGLYKQVATKLPPIRALWRLLQDIDLRELASIEPGQRVVFSNQPTLRQVDLPDTAFKRISIFVDEQNSVAGHLSDIEPHSSYMMESDGARNTLAGPPGRLVFAVERSSDGTTFPLRLTMLDQAGTQLCETQHHLRVPTFDVDPYANAPEDLEVELTPFSKEIVRFWNWAMGPKTSLMKLSEDSIEVVVNPERNEPLSSFVSDILLGWADKAGKNGIFYPDDTLVFPAIAASMAGKPRLSSFLKSSENVIQVQDEDGWLIVKPQRPLQALHQRADRAALGTYLRRLRKEGYLSVSNAAAFAASYRGSELPMIPTLSTILTVTDLAQLQMNDSDVLRFIGTLDEQNLQNLSRGFTARDLRPEQFEPLEILLYKLTYWEIRGEEPLGFEPTEFMPTEIPLGLLITGSIEEKEALSITSLQQDGSSYTRTADLAELASWMSSDPSFRLVSAGEATIRTFKLVFSLPTGKTKRVQCEESYRRGQEYPVAELPDRIKRKIDEELERIKGYGVPQPEPKPPFRQ